MTLGELQEWRDYFEDTGELPEDTIEALFNLAEQAIESGMADGSDEET